MSSSAAINIQKAPAIVGCRMTLVPLLPPTDSNAPQLCRHLFGGHFHNPGCGLSVFECLGVGEVYDGNINVVVIFREIVHSVLHKEHVLASPKKGETRVRLSCSFSETDVPFRQPMPN
jgi:hypothetical protein